MSRRIQITRDDMASLRELIQASGEAARAERDRLAELEAELDEADVVAPGALVPDVVTMHSTVRVRDLDSGVQLVYTLVFPAEADIRRRRISVLAPIGIALIGYRVGDRIEWPTPGGRRRLEIEQVLFQPESAAV